MEFKDRIKDLRNNRNMTTKQLGEIFGKSDTAIRMWEIGRSKPDADTLIRLSVYFNCTTDYLLGLSELKNQDERIKLEEQFSVIAKNLESMPRTILDMAMYTIYHYVSFWRIEVKDIEIKESLYIYLSNILKNLSMFPTIIPAIQDVLDGKIKAEDKAPTSSEFLLMSVYESIKDDRKEIDGMMDKYISQIEKTAYSTLRITEDKENAMRSDMATYINQERDSFLSFEQGVSQDET